MAYFVPGFAFCGCEPVAYYFNIHSTRRTEVPNKHKLSTPVHVIELSRRKRVTTFLFSFEREVISIRMLRMRLISAIINFYWSHPIALQKLSNERSYKFS